MRVSAGDEPKTTVARILDRPAFDELAVSLPPLGNAPDPARSAVRHPFLDVVEEAAADPRQELVLGDEVVELVAVEDQEAEPAVVVDVFIQDIHADDVAHDVGRAVVVPPNYSRDAASSGGDNTATAMKSVVVDSSAYDWEGDTPLRRPSSRTIVYELHVRGFTRDASSGLPERTRGTYAGLIDKIPYLQDLGITAAELLNIAFLPSTAR